MTAATEQKMRDLLILDHPTSLNVVSAVLRVIGEMYPASMVRSDTGHVLHVQVPEGILPREIDWDTLTSEYPLDDDL